LKINALFVEGFGHVIAQVGTGVPLKSVLLVDDGRSMRMASERALARAEYAVVTASDGEEALRMAHARIPDLILLDMPLAKLVGPEVLDTLRRNPLTASIPVIVLSRLLQENEAKRSRRRFVEVSRGAFLQHSESLIQIVKRILDEQTEKNGDAEIFGLGLPSLPGKGAL